MACLFAILPSIYVVVLVAVLAWFAAPGVLLARRLYGSQPGAWGAAFLAGPAWGYVFSSVVLLVLWAMGVRRFVWLMASPIPALAVVWPARALANNLSIPAVGKRDVAAISLVLLSVPAIVGLPFAHVGANLPEGRAYRAYFTADMVWAAAVVSEVSKGDIPPANPFYLNDSLHYYWFAHLLPAAEHRAFPRRLSIDQILLVNAVASGLAFVGFFYFFVRHFVDRPWAAAIGCLGVIFCSSFEGAERLWTLWRAGQPVQTWLDSLRAVNIDAVTRWFHAGMPVDGLQRLLLYQPQHQLAYLLGLSALLLLAEARNAARAAVLFLVGAFLGLALVVSSFDAVMLVVMVAAYEAWRLIRVRCWTAFLPCMLAAAAPMAVGVAAILALGYIDTGGRLVAIGVNRVATGRVWENLFLSFGPVAIAAAAGVCAAALRGATGRFVPVWIALATCGAFYFLVDLPDHGSVYVGWHAGHLAFITMAALVAYALQESWAAGGVPRVLTTVGLSIVALVALPMVVIDIYNTQDVWNRDPGPGYRMTVVLTPRELAGLDWIIHSTPQNARVQVDPSARERDTWSYIPTFAERRMSYGLPISMIPTAKYEAGSRLIRELYLSTSARDVYDRAVNMCIDDLVVGAPERDAYPQFQPMLDRSPELFPALYRNSDIVVYGVSRNSAERGCRREP
ncbi:MAG TPA: hypothetical protein VGJ29_05315 [Vicinamibacterales bacterium]